MKSRNNFCRLKLLYYQNTQKMKRLTIVLLFFTAISYGQELIKQDLSSFNELKVFSGLNVELIKSNKSYIEITGDEAEHVLVKMNNETLKLSFNFTKSMHPEDVFIRLYYKNPLMMIDANEGSFIESETTFVQNYIELKAQEGANIQVSVRVKQLDIKTTSGSEIRVKGNAENTQVEAHTGASYFGYHVSNTDAKVNSTAGSKVEVNVSGILDANARLGGAIYFRGNPEVLKTKKVLGGIIEQVN